MANLKVRRGRKMKSGQENQTTNVVLLRTRSDGARGPLDGPRGDNIIRLLDLSKYEQPRTSIDNYNANMRANIVAMVFLGLLVFLAREDFCKLEQANLCATRSECFN
jgi:hypothetical protein